MACLGEPDLPGCQPPTLGTGAAAAATSGISIAAALPRAPRLRHWVAARALPILLILSVCLPALGLVAVIIDGRRNIQRKAEAEVMQAAETAAAHGARMLDSQRLLGQRVDDLLRGRADVDIVAHEAELHAEVGQMVRQVSGPPQVSVMDRGGHLLLSARRFPVPKDRSYLDRDYFVALGEPDPPPLFVSPAYAGRVTGQTLFAIAFRRTGTANGLAPGSFDGVVTVSVYLAELMTELTRLLPHDTDRITLARQDGAILVSTRAYDAPPQAQRISAELQQRMAAGPVSGALFLPAEGERPARLLTVRPVPGWPVLVEASRPWAVILRQREQHLLRSLGIGLPALALMALLARLVWQRNLQLRQANEGLEAEVLDRTEALSASEAEFRAIFESSVAGMAQADPGTRRLTRVNDRFCDITGYSAAELTGGMTFLDLSPPEDRAAEAERFRRAMAGSGRIVLEKRYQRRDGSIAWVHLSVALVPAGAGRPARNVATVHDITDRKLAEDRQTLLAREVDHRAKNALAVVQAALRLTPKEDPVAFASAIEGRVGALARAQSLLADTQWQGASLHALVEAEVAAFMAGGSGAPQVILDGPPISVPAQLSQPLSLALHELATNATKYGALSRPGGQVRISWSLEASRLRLEWREQGGPVVSGAPNRSGFGSRLLGTTVRLQLGGSLVQHWPPEGMVCVLDVPLERQAEPALPAGSHRP